MLEITKICSKCKIEQPFSCFGKKTDAKDGYTTACKTCKKEHDKQAYENNKDKILQQKQKYYIDNKKDINTKNNQYYKNNKSTICIQKKQYYSYHKSDICIQKSEYHCKNKTRLSLRYTEYRKTPMGKAVMANKNHRRRSQEREGDVTTVQLLELTKNATNCFWCDVSLTTTKIQIDHFYPLSRGGKHTLSNLVVACPKCNNSKNAKDPFEFARSIGKIL